MGLSTALDIAIGLIFIYLIVSLLASEIQELISTILQWRAVHLKESIEGLLSGHADKDEELKKVRGLANQVYENPLISDLNQSAKGIASIPRSIQKLLSEIIHWINNRFSWKKGEDKLFPTGSGPSYISKEAFTASLFETLKIPAVTREIIKSRLENLIIESRLEDLLKDKGNSSYQEWARFRDDKIKIFTDFDNGKITLADTLDRLVESAKLVKDINFFKSIFKYEYDNSFGLSAQRNKILSQELTPSLVEIVEKVKESPMPESLKKSLSDLAARSQARVEDLEKQLNQFQKDAEDWFDSSMERANGVYKRNAKLIAFLIGLTIAIVGNVDTLHVVDRISKDQALQRSLNRAADNIVAGNKKLDDKTIAEINAAAEKISLPVGWGESVTVEQQRRSIKWIPSYVVTPVGWIISAIAISMGSSFWFDLLGKVINVKNVGKVPDSSSSSNSSATSSGSTSSGLNSGSTSSGSNSGSTSSGSISR